MTPEWIVLTDELGDELRVHVSHVAVFRPTNKKGCKALLSIDGHIVPVKETVTEIMLLIQGEEIP